MNTYLETPRLLLKIFIARQFRVMRYAHEERFHLLATRKLSFAMNYKRRTLP
jgi:hypothetical protein